MKLYKSSVMKATHCVTYKKICFLKDKALHIADKCGTHNKIQRDLS